MAIWYAVYGLPLPRRDSDSWKREPSFLIAVGRSLEDIEYLLPKRNGEGYFNAYPVEVEIDEDAPAMCVPLSRQEVYDKDSGFVTPSLTSLEGGG